MNSALPLESIVETIIDYRGRTPPKSGSGVRLVTAKAIKGGFIRNDPVEFISPETYETWMRRGYPRVDDVLVTTEAPLGEVAPLRSEEPVALAQRVILLRAAPDVIDPDYLLYVMQSPGVQQQLRARATGTTVLGIKQAELRKVLIPLPAMKEQRATGSALRCIDDLIATDLQRITLLLAAIRRIYEDRFGQFRDPGVPVPAEWRRGPLSGEMPFDIAKPPVPAYEGERTYLATADVAGVHEIVGGTSLAFQHLPSRAQHAMTHESVWFARMANYQKVLLSHRGVDVQRFVLSSGFMCITAPGPWWSYVSARVLAEDFESEKARFASGATQVSLTDAGARQMNWVVPATAAVKQFDDQVRAMLELVVALREEIEGLRSMRSRVLPHMFQSVADGGTERRGQPKK